MNKLSGPYLIGLTGSIGMGKSTVAGFFAETGVAVWDADGAVHRLYGANQAGSKAMADIVPDAVTADGVDRAILSAKIGEDRDLLPAIEAAIHPLVAEERRTFIRNCDADIAVLDIPLLFEGEGSAPFDCIVVASASPAVQRERVLARPGMTEEKLALILSKQLPDQEKRRRADFVIPTDVPLEETRVLVHDLVREIRQRIT